MSMLTNAAFAPPDLLRRRAVLGRGMAGAVGGLALPAAALLAAAPARALPVRTLVFPRDFGAHPEFGIEWWYITGHATSGGGARRFGFQVTFFRSRVAQADPLAASRFAARQLVFAHAAVSDVAQSRLWHDQRIGRSAAAGATDTAAYTAGFDSGSAATADTALRLRDWTLSRTATGYRADIAARDFALALRFDETQPLLLQGAAGLSRKGPEAAQASYYYSKPQLRVAGHIALAGRRWPIDAAAGGGTSASTGSGSSGAAWLDHEWSDALLHPDAVGWDWIGMNLFDGSALTAFRLRRADGSALWAGGSWRAPGTAVAQAFGERDVVFTPRRVWQSSRTGARYPTAWRVATPAGSFGVAALFDDQELDSRASTGSVYWEGLSELRDAAGRAVGRGYLELTGYAQPLRL